MGNSIRVLWREISCKRPIGSTNFEKSPHKLQFWEVANTWLYHANPVKRSYHVNSPLILNWYDKENESYCTRFPVIIPHSARSLIRTNKGKRGGWLQVLATWIHTNYVTLFVFWHTITTLSTRLPNRDLNLSCSFWPGASSTGVLSSTSIGPAFRERGKHCLYYDIIIQTFDVESHSKRHPISSERQCLHLSQDCQCLPSHSFSSTSAGCVCLSIRNGTLCRHLRVTVCRLRRTWVWECAAPSADVGTLPRSRPCTSWCLGTAASWCLGSAAAGPFAKPQMFFNKFNLPTSAVEFLWKLLERVFRRIVGYFFECFGLAKTTVTKRTRCWIYIDWCYFYYFIRHSLVALLDALFVYLYKMYKIWPWHNFPPGEIWTYDTNESDFISFKQLCHVLWFNHLAVANQKILNIFELSFPYHQCSWLCDGNGMTQSDCICCKHFQYEFWFGFVQAVDWGFLIIILAYMTHPVYK